MPRLQAMEGMVELCIATLSGGVFENIRRVWEIASLY